MSLYDLSAIFQIKDISSISLSAFSLSSPFDEQFVFLICFYLAINNFKLFPWAGLSCCKAYPS